MMNMAAGQAGNNNQRKKQPAQCVLVVEAREMFAGKRGVHAGIFVGIVQYYCC